MQAVGVKPSLHAAYACLEAIGAEGWQRANARQACPPAR